MLCAAIAVLVELPRFVAVDRDWWQERFLLWIAFAGLVAFVLHVRRASVRIRWSALACMAACVAMIGLLPERVAEDPLLGPTKYDSLVVALWSVPLVLLGLAGVAYAGERWRQASAWAEVARIGSGWFVIAGVLLFAQLLLGLATYGLLVSMLSLYGADRYLASAMMIGVSVTPVVAACIQVEMGERLAPLATLLARMFAPLAVVVVAVGLAGTAVQSLQGSEGVELLDVTQGLLLVAVFVGMFAMSVRRNDDDVSVTDLVPVALMVMTVPLAGMALGVLVLRMMEFGVTATGVAAVGMDVVILGQAVGMMAAAIRGRGRLATIRAAAVGYLPVYFAAAAVVAFVVPVVFGGR